MNASRNAHAAQSLLHSQVPDRRNLDLNAPDPTLEHLDNIDAPALLTSLKETILEGLNSLKEARLKEAKAKAKEG